MKKEEFGLAPLFALTVFVGMLCADLDYDNLIMHTLSCGLCFVVVFLAAAFAWSLGETIEKKNSTKACVVALVICAALAVLLSGIRANTRTKAIEAQRKEAFEQAYNIGYEDAEQHRSKDFSYWYSD